MASIAASTDCVVLLPVFDDSQMAAALGERLIEAEINPIFVLPQGQGVRAADGVAVLAP